MRMKKYEITDIVHPDNPNLHRIRALMDLTENIQVEIWVFRCKFIHLCY